jgi:hypothetical protein
MMHTGKCRKETILGRLEEHRKARREEPPAATHAGSSLANFSTLKKEAIRSSETSVYIRSSRRHIPDDGILHSHRCKNLKS